MLKPLLFILVGVVLIALALNFDFFSNPSTPKSIIEVSIEKIKVAPTPKNEIVLIEKEPVIINENNLTKELQLLLSKAQKLFQESKDSDALLLYEEIISKSKNSKDIKLLKIFAEACFKKASLHYIYPSYDIDSAIESYELIINNFKTKHNKELLLLYMTARLQLAGFTPKDEILITYDELIEKFQKDKEQRFEKEIEDLLFAKSFALMGVNDEEAIEVLDKIIARYDDKSNLPDTVKFSILNNIELSIITANETDKYVDLANQYMADSPHTKPLLDMLSIIKNAQYLEQTMAIEKWTKEHKEYLFPDWDFSELRKWVNKMETPESQERIRQYLDLFEKQKYKNIYQVPVSTVPTNSVYKDEATQNTSLQPYVAVENEELVYEEFPAYEADPHLNDIINSQEELNTLNSY
ncbi:MAG: Unknown protein [uncultured Sulfurovum sp.]|uniref:Uncharacterized protein n=1 Tax=uncultured Sulfurovum sp. TaxID=269237 RepID=A0A6S6T0J2_9BACT|nr:MAG: Unknown protein [uncultured Sulfurovum sp.]